MWKIAGESGNDGEAYIIAEQAAPFREVAWVNESDGNTKAFAQAQLIAAAPDLLEASGGL